MKKFMLISALIIIVGIIAAFTAMQTVQPDQINDVPTVLAAFEPDDISQSPEPEPVPEPVIIQEPEPVPDPIHIRVQFAGDILLHGGLGAGTGRNIFNYRPFMWAIKPYINGDLAIVNMETPVDVFGGNQGIATWPRFNAPFEILDGLIYAGFNHLISANNHSFDKGFDGLVATIKNFERAGITQTGMYTNEYDFNKPTIIDVEGVQVGIIAYTDSVNGLESLVPEDVRPFAVRRFRSHVIYDVPYMSADMAAIRDAGADLIIVSLHWGAEYVNAPTYMQMQIARGLIEGGADIIMGHHSHTPQPLEWHYREDGSRGLIIYSLGNFLADQIALNIPATQYGMLVTAYISKCHEGNVEVYNANVLPTVFVRDSARSLGSPYSILPVINGEVPEEVENEQLRAWGRRAYNHVLYIVGDEFIMSLNATNREIYAYTADVSSDVNIEDVNNQNAEYVQFNNRIVAIDPGHQRRGNYTQYPNGPGSSNYRGKVASGTRGIYTGVPEYVLVLDVAFFLRDELIRRGYEVFMVRECHDVDISNAERARMATAANADVFIRIHADGSENQNLRGIMTISHTANNPYIPHLYTQSRALSDAILNEMVAITGANNRGVWETDTMTGSNWATMPVTIVEMGFMTNPEEDRLMQTSEYQMKLAEGIANGIDLFFVNN